MVLIGISALKSIESAFPSKSRDLPLFRVQYLLHYSTTDNDSSLTLSRYFFHIDFNAFTLLEVNAFLSFSK